MQNEVTEIIRLRDLALLHQSYFQYIYISRISRSYELLHKYTRAADRAGSLNYFYIVRFGTRERSQPADREITPTQSTKSFEIPLKLRDTEAFLRVQRNRNCYFGCTPKPVT